MDVDQMAKLRYISNKHDVSITDLFGKAVTILLDSYEKKNGVIKLTKSQKPDIDSIFGIWRKKAGIFPASFFCCSFKFLAVDVLNKGIKAKAEESDTHSNEYQLKICKMMFHIIWFCNVIN